MKKLFTLLAAVTLSAMLFAQAPQSFSYQTVIRDANWQPISNQSVSIKIEIIEDAVNGFVVHEESHSATTNDIGLVNLAIGSVITQGSQFQNINWSQHTHFIRVSVDVSGGLNYIVMGTTQLRSVPYALYAETSGSMLPGPQGIAGNDGLDGINGVDGAPGVDGINGIDGLPGADGTDGIDGTNGTNGQDGAPGIQGVAGATGNPGTNGVNGTNGTNGAQGLPGNDGIDGVDGNDGQDGNDGAQGIAGDDGNDGAPGTNGTNGDDGYTPMFGVDYFNGADGINGNDGADGIDGTNGASGVDGTNGTNGVDGIDGIDAVVDYDSLANIISVDSVFITTVTEGIDSLTNNSQVESSDFENQTTNSDFNNNITTQIPQSLDGKKIIIYSTDKTIYLTDSVGSFTSVLYSVSSNTIGNLTSNASGDTLYFLQSANSGSATPNIMMTSINNINPVVVGSLPCTQQQLKQFKYFNGNFYYLKTTDLLEISNGSPSVLNSTQNNYCFTVDSLGTIYRAYYLQGGSLINSTSYSGPTYEYLFDIDVSESENRIYFWRSASGGDIGYWDLNSNSATILFTADGSYESSTTEGEQVVRYHDGFVYFNQAKSLFSVQNDGSNSRIISSSNDAYNITGIVIVD